MNKIFDNVYLFSDIDGTLASTKSYIPQENKKAIEYFVENGGTFGVATGRYLGDIDLLEELPVNGLCILNNGASIYDYSKKEKLYSKILPNNIMSSYLKFLEKNQNIGLLIVNDLGYITTKIDNNNRPRLDERYQVKSLQELELPYYKIMFVIEDRNIQEVIVELELIGIEDVDYVQTGETTLEVVPKNVSKGDTFTQICKDYSIEKSKTYFIGDSFNDIEIMKRAGLSACVSHAPNEVKTHADVLACDFEKGAVANFIEIIKSRLI